MRYTLLSWLLNTLQKLILKNSFVKISIRAVLLLWSKLFPWSPGWPRKFMHQISSSEKPRRQMQAGLGKEGPGAAQQMTNHVDCSEGYFSVPPPCSIDPSSFHSLQSLPLYDTPVCDHTVNQSPRPFSTHSPSDLENTNIPLRSSPIQEAMDPDGDVVSSRATVSFAHSRIHPIFPECIGRYDRNVIVPREDTEYKIPSLTTTLILHDDPLGWCSHLHPEGALYFYHEEKRIFTDANLYDHALLSQIHADIDIIEDFLRAHNIERSPDDDLVLELIQQDEGNIETSYYLADHSRRFIYFLDEFDASNLPVWPEVDGVTSPTHIKHEIEVQYWWHCLLYPRALKLNHELLIELRDIITYYISDQMLSRTSTAPYDIDNLQKMLSLVNSLEKTTDSDFKGSTCVLSSLMFVFVRQRFLNFHGQPGARLNRDQSVYGKPTNKRSWLILLLSPLLFYAPEVHLKALEKMWMDGLMRDAVWVQFINKLNTEWQEFTLYATVLLNANVAFLAIQSVDNDEGTYRSPAQIFSYVSIINSIGSIILGLLLVRQNRTKAKDTAYEVSVFLYRRSSLRLGLETMAIMFSLPYALLMLGMVSFLVAFLFICFQNSNISTRLVVGIMWVAIAILIVWCISVAWEHREPKGNPEVEVEVEEETKGASSEGQLNDVQSPTRGKLWPWLVSSFRRSSHDSDMTVV